MHTANDFAVSAAVAQSEEPPACTRIVGGSTPLGGSSVDARVHTLPVAEDGSRRPVVRLAGGNFSRGICWCPYPCSLAPDGCERD